MAQKRFLRFEQNGQPLVIEYDSIALITTSLQSGDVAVSLKNGDEVYLSSDNAKRLLKHISSDCFVFDKPEEDI